MINVDTSSFMPPVFSDWYVVQCKPRQEYRAKDNIENQSGQVLLFEREVECIRKGKRDFKKELWFPGYIFVHLPENNLLWSSIRSTYGVSKLVRFGDKPVPLRPATLRVICENVNNVVKKPKFTQGDGVTIHSGPFKGIEAVFQAYDGQMRAVLLMSFLHREQEVKVPLSSIK